jgi:UDP-N-acetylglucosamine/UDP-N-acetylgalactosamine diphosphorylase
MSLDKLLKQFKQSHLLSIIPTKEEENRLLQQLLSFEKQALDQQMRSFVEDKRKKEKLLVAPLQVLAKQKEEWRAKGEELLVKGKAAALMLAAGEGSRLGFLGPKGCFPLSIVKQKSLFQIFCEKILAYQKRSRKDFFLMIMTSSLNRKETEEFFHKHRFFGLKKEQVSFFSQELFPLCDLQGKWFLEEGLIAARAKGNGDLYRCFHNANLLEKCKERGIEKLLIFPVDNPLADPCDRELLGFHGQGTCDVAIKAIRRPKRETSMGLLAEKKGVIQVVEYLTISPKEMELFPFANTGLYCMSLAFLEKAHSLSLPLHRVEKTIRTPQGEKSIFKFERFLFDAFVFAKTKVLLDQKSSCFAPLKRKCGKEGISSVHRALLCKERKLFFQCAKRRLFQKKFELSQEFYYPTPELTTLYRKKKSFHDRYFKGIDL